MKVIITDSLHNLEQNQKSNFFNLVIDQILLICKEDSNFTKNNNIKLVSNKIEVLKDKIERYDKLLTKAETMKVKFEANLKNLQASNLQKKTKLLESLGSDI